jgi:hypothetical protein
MAGAETASTGIDFAYLISLMHVIPRLDRWTAHRLSMSGAVGWLEFSHHAARPVPCESTKG